MRLCIYEDSATSWLEPITLTRPAFDLWCGAQHLFERHQRQFAASEVGFWMRPALVELWKLDHPDQPVNDVAWLRAAPTVWINGRWLPAANSRIEDERPHIGIEDGQIAYVVVSASDVPPTEAVDAWLTSCKDRLPHRPAAGVMLNYVFDAVEHNSESLRQDSHWFRARTSSRPLSASVAIQGPAEQLLIADDAVVEPFVFADTRGGPVMIDQGARVHAFSRLEGPCYIGKGTWIVGAKVREGTTIGPGCRIGGEVEESIIQGYSNKYHDGFLGHSYLGEWVNLAAATQTSDLRNDYDAVRVTINGERIASGKNKAGSYIGDHTKTGLGALLNTGSTVGAFASLLPSGTLLPQVVPSFTQVQFGRLQEAWDLQKLFTTASRVMLRRGKTLSDAHKDFYYGLFDGTAMSRQRIMREGEIRKLRKSF